MLRHLQHKYIVKVVNVFMGDHDDLYIILEAMQTDLYKIIYSKNDLSDDHIQYFIYQLLRGMKYMHSAKVRVHVLQKLNWNVGCYDLPWCWP